MRFHRSLLFGLLAAVPGYTQSGSVATPMMGFAFDATAAAIRPIRGIPGAALLGQPLDAGFAIGLTSISPRQDFALAVSAADSRLRLVPLSAGVNAGALPEAALSAPDQIRFSPAGTAALLFQSSGRLQALSGLPGNASVREIDLSALSLAPAAMAVSDDGALVALSGDSGAWAVNSDGSSFQLALPGSTAVLSFRGNSHDLVAVSTTGDVHIVRHPGSDSAYRLIYAADAQTAGPVAAQFSTDGSRAYTVNGNGNVAAIEIETGDLRTVSCGCRATALESLNTRNLFRLTSAGESVLMLFDGGTGEPRIWFVPPDRTSRETEGSVQ